MGKFDGFTVLPCSPRLEFVDIPYREDMEYLAVFENVLLIDFSVNTETGGSLNIHQMTGSHLMNGDSFA